MQQRLVRMFLDNSAWAVDHACDLAREADARAITGVLRIARRCGGPAWLLTRHEDIRSG